jgi:hypothetical protein
VGSTPYPAPLSALGADPYPGNGTQAGTLGLADEAPTPVGVSDETTALHFFFVQAAPAVLPGRVHAEPFAEGVGVSAYPVGVESGEASEVLATATAEVQDASSKI